MGPSMSIPQDLNPENKVERQLTRREKRDFKNKLKKPKYQKLAKKIIQSKSK